MNENLDPWHIAKCAIIGVMIGVVIGSILLSLGIHW